MPRLRIPVCILATGWRTLLGESQPVLNYQITRRWLEDH